MTAPGGWKTTPQGGRWANTTPVFTTLVIKVYRPVTNLASVLFMSDEPEAPIAAAEEAITTVVNATPVLFHPSLDLSSLPSSGVWMLIRLISHHM